MAYITRYTADYWATKMLQSVGLNSRIDTCYGNLNDHYSPETDTIWLTVQTSNSQTAQAAAIACHEVGHANLCHQGFQGKRLEQEKQASALALKFLEEHLNPAQFQEAQEFLRKALATYQR